MSEHTAEIDAWLREVKYLRVQVRDEDGTCHTIAEFRNGSRACSCGLERGETPRLRPPDPQEDR